MMRYPEGGHDVIVAWQINRGYPFRAAGQAAVRKVATTELFYAPRNGLSFFLPRRNQFLIHLGFEEKEVAPAAFRRFVRNQLIELIDISLSGFLSEWGEYR